MVGKFNESFRNRQLDPDAEKRKSIVRSLLSQATLGGDEVTLDPHVEQIAGFKMALPRGLEPRFSP